MHQIVYPDHARAVDHIVLEEGFLDLLRANVGAVVHDDLLLAALEPEIALLVGPHNVAGVEPAVLNGLGCRVRPVPIADHIGGRLDPEPARLARGKLPAVLVADRGLVAGIQAADRAQLVDARRRIDRREANFAHAPNLINRKTDQLGELLLKLRRHLVTPRYAEPN